MLIRICLIVAILAAVGAVALNVTQVKGKITTLVTQRDDWNKKFTTADTDLKKAKKDLVSSQADLKQTKDKLAATTTEKEAAVKKADAETKRASELADKLSKTTQEREDAKAELARYTGTGISVERILAFDKEIKVAKEALDAASEENRILQRQATRLQARLDIYETPDKFVTAPENLKGTVLVSDPKWDFVVLDIGEDQSATSLENCEFLVSRAGRLVAKVKVSTVQKGRSIANVVPGWKLSEVVEGDQVIPAHPAL